MNNKSHKIDEQALSTRYADLLDAQTDADLLLLIDDLETLYASATLPTQLIQGDRKGHRDQGDRKGRPYNTLRGVALMLLIGGSLLRLPDRGTRALWFCGEDAG